MKDYRELHARACSCVWHLDSCRQLSLCCLRVVAVLYRCSYVLRFLVASRHSACHVFSCWNSSGSRASSTASASKKSTSKGGSEVQFSSSWRLRLFACSLPRSFSFSIFFARVCCVFRHPRNAGVFFYLIGFVFALPCSLSFLFWPILYSHASEELSLLCWLFVSFHATYKYTLSLYPALSRSPSASSRCQSGKMMTRRGRPLNSTWQHRNTSEFEISGNFETYLAGIGQLFPFSMPWTSVSSPCPSPHVLSPPSRHSKGKSQVQGTIYGITHMQKWTNVHEKWMKMTWKCIMVWNGIAAGTDLAKCSSPTRPFCASAWLHRIWLQSVPGMVERCGKHKLLQIYDHL